MSKLNSFAFLGVIAVSSLVTMTASAASLRINGSTTVNPVAAEAAEILRAQNKMAIVVDTQGGSSGGISGIGDGSIDIGMSSKPIAQEDRAKYPKVNFVETKIGQDAVAIVVAAAVYNGGVKAVTKAQARDLYEGKITNWKQLGGPDQKVVFLNKEPGRGTWEVFAKWLYGDPKAAPEVSHQEVGGNEETRTKVISTKGAVSQLSSAWAENNPRIKALSVRLDDGRVVPPTAANIADGTYPMSRPLFFITNGPATGEAKRFIDFVLTPRGQELVKKHGYLRISDLMKGTPAPARRPATPAKRNR